MKVATWNLQRVQPLEDRASLIRKQIEVVDADIWILTETHEIVSPGEDFSSVMCGKHDGESKPGEHWAGIWSRYPITHLQSFVSDASRCAAALVRHPDFGDVTVYAMVLPWGGSSWGGVESAGGAAFSAALAAYVEDWTGLRKSFPNALHVVAGDFNQDLAPYHYYGSKIQRGRLEAALSAAQLTALTAGVNDPIERDAGDRHACIDHICVSNGNLPHIVTITRWPEAGKPDSRLSDHFGVAVDFRPT